VELLPKLDLIALLVDFSFRSGIYMHGDFPSISFRGEKNDPVLPTMDTPIFKGRSGDYDPKSVRGSPNETSAELGSWENEPNDYQQKSSDF
jgi:hypothetical protein